MNSLCANLGIRIPIMQAPAGSIAGPELAAAVSRAGALGSMGLTWTDPKSAQDSVRKAAGLTREPFAANFVLWFEPQALAASLEAGLPIVTFSWGVPRNESALARSFGAKVGIQVGSAAGAKPALDLQPDFVICQGIEAGGHVQSTTPLNDLLAEVVDICGDLPVMAAGGIATGTDIARVLASGAQGAMLGTRFVATVESRAHDAYRRKILEAKADSTALTICFDGGWSNAPHRVLRNRTLEMWESAGCPRPGRRPGEADRVAFDESGRPVLRYEDTAPRAGMSGDLEDMALYGGTGVGEINDVPSAHTLVERLWREAREAGIASVFR